MDPFEQEELDIEYNSRYDYIAELEAEHRDYGCGEDEYYDELHAANVAAFGPYVFIRSAADDAWGDDLAF